MCFDCPLSICIGSLAMGSEAPSRLARRPLLTNSAAEFTETRLDALFGPGLSRSSDIEFMPENDRFESRDENTPLVASPPPGPPSALIRLRASALSLCNSRRLLVWRSSNNHS